MEYPITLFKGEYDWLSNMYKLDNPFVIDIGTEIEPEFVTYLTSEHYYQACKTINPREKKLIAACSDGYAAKNMGRKITITKDWDFRKLHVMYNIVKQKFANNPKLLEKLQKTADVNIVEGNFWHDNYWGDCSCPKCKNTPGENNLGKILMKVREELR